MIKFYKDNSKRNILGVFVLISTSLSSQVGISTPNPAATLDIVASTTNGTKAEGFIAPRLTGDQIKLGDSRYAAAQKGAIIYATAPVTLASAKTANILTEGYYFLMEICGRK